jgi:DNA-binding IscR family transcriptional regulator
VYGAVFDTPALSDPECPLELRNAWRKLQQALDTAADAINFEQLLRESGDRKEMYYI